MCAQASVQEQRSSHISLKPLIGFRVGFFTVVQEWFIKPRGNTRIWFTSKVAKEALPSPSHFVGNPQGFVDTPVLVVLLPPRRVLRVEVGDGEILLLLLPLLVGW